MLIIDRALMREALQTSTAVTLVFVSLFVVVSLVNVLSQAAMGEVPARIVFMLLGLQTVKMVGFMLPLALFVGILLTLGRWYRESEMTVLAACGIDLMHFVRPTLVLASGFALVAALFSFYLAPLSSSLISKLKNDPGGRYEAGGIMPGVFNDVGNGRGTYYVEHIDKGQASLNNIFVSTEQSGKEGVLVARSGRQYTDKETGDQYLMLQDGTRYEGSPGQADYSIFQFERYALRIEPPQARDPLIRFETLTTPQILGMESEVNARGEATIPHWRRGLAAEWHWRLSKPAQLFLLALLALAFSYNHPRQGRYGGLFVAILMYFVYTNLLTFSDAMLKQGRIPLALGMWWVHGVFLVLSVYLLVRRSNNLPLIPLPAFFRHWSR
jgi:lipopolysaccharide export system permease protein